MQYFITGITGFAGPHLARLLLRQGHSVHALVRESNGSEMDLVDVLDVRELEKIVYFEGGMPVFALSNLVADLAYAVVDPRIRLQ